MSKLIVCLGYNLQPNNSVHPILENRLKDTVDLCCNNKNSFLLLMGSSSYQNLEGQTISEASAMKEYLEKNFRQALGDVKILTEETTTSTVEQLCYLKKFIETERLKYSDLIIVSSKFFGDRVKLYAEYIFGTIVGVVFVESLIPQKLIEQFQKVEEDKFKQAKNWLSNHKEGDDQTILTKQKAFQNQVKKGKINQPFS